MEEGRDDEGAKPDSRPGRVDSLANFQIYTLAVRSRAGCFEEREGRGRGQLRDIGRGPWLGSSSVSYTRTMLDFLRARVCVRATVYKNLLPSLPLSCWASFAAREQVESSISGIRMG